MLWIYYDVPSVPESEDVEHLETLREKVRVVSSIQLKWNHHIYEHYFSQIEASY